MQDQQPRPRIDWWLGVAIGSATLALLLATLDRPIITWDEGYTIRREAMMRAWFERLVSPPAAGNARTEQFQEPVLQKYWPFAREEPDGHPPFYAVIGNVGWCVGYTWLPAATEHRLGPALLFSFTTAILYVFMAGRYGRLAAVTAAGTWVLMPRLFAHAHLASYDVPLACLWLLTCVAFWKSYEGWSKSYSAGVGWSAVWAVLLGLAAATKFTGWLIPIPLAAWSLAAVIRRLRRDGWPSLRRPFRALLCLAPLALVAVAEVSLLYDLRETELHLAVRPGEDGQARAQRVAQAFRSAESNWPMNLALFMPAAIWLATYGSIAAWRAVHFDSKSAPAFGLADTWATAALVPSVTVAFIPNWWHDPLRGIAIFLWSNLTRQTTTWIPTQFFGKFYEFSLPWYNTLAWLALTVPPLMLLWMLLGLLATLVSRAGDGAEVGFDAEVPGGHMASRASAASLAWLLFWNAATLLVIRALPGSPGHDSERQLIGSFPFLACIAGLGAAWLRDQLQRRMSLRVANRVVSGLVAFSFVASAGAIWHYRTAPLSYYTELIGGLRGAARLGMEPTYYWDAFDSEVIDWLNQHTRPGEKLRFCNYFDSLGYLRRWEILRVPILPTEPGLDRWYVLQNRPGLFAWNPTDRWLAEHGQPAYTRELDGVPLIWVFPFSEYERATRETR